MVASHHVPLQGSSNPIPVSEPQLPLSTLQITLHKFLALNISPSLPTHEFSKMYMAYGWPQIIPLELPNCPSTQQIVHLKVVNRLLLVVAPTHLELWSSSQHRVRLGKYKRNFDSVQREGENLRAIWSPDTKLIAVLTSSFYLLIFKIQMTEKRIHIGGKQPTGLFLANISLLLSEQVPFGNEHLTVSNCVCDNKHILIGLSDGSLYNISWKGEFCGAFFLHMLLNDSTGANKLFNHFGNGLTTRGMQGFHVSNPVVSQTSGVVYLEFCITLRLLFVLFSDGELLQCSVSKRGLKHAESIIVDRRLASGEAVCTSVASEQQFLAVGTRKGVVELYDLADSASLIRSVSLHDWGFWKQPQDSRSSSASLKEPNAHIASVKSILECHASYLMSGKELSNLVAFVKGTQFDLVDYLQRERYGGARLENFASGLEMVGQKLYMGNLQNRLDTEFLLAHMCSVKFKEWMVVLATLLRRSEVLYDLFRHDLRLWKAYSVTIQAHEPLAEYHDLLQELDGKLLSTVDTEQT